MFKVTVDGLGDVKQEYEKTLRELNTVESILDREVLGLERQIKETSPVDTGRYRAAWMSEKHGGRGFTEWILSNNVFYAVYLVFGTRRMDVKHNIRGIVDSWSRGLNERLKRHFK